MFRLPPVFESVECLIIIEPCPPTIFISNSNQPHFPLLTSTTYFITTTTTTTTHNTDTFNMDAPEEDLDIKLQKVSADLISDFDSSLISFLRKPSGVVRSRVRTRETERLIGVCPLHFYLFNFFFPFLYS